MLDFAVYAIVLIVLLQQLWLPAKKLLDDKLKTSAFGGSLQKLHLALFAYFLATEFSRSFFPLFIKRFSVASLDLSTMMALPQIVWGLTALVATPCGHLLAKRYGQKRVLCAAFIISGLSIVIMSLTNSYWLMLLARAAMAASYGTVAIVALIYLASRGGATIIAISMSTLAGASICGAALGGIMTDYFSFSTILLFSSIFAFLAPIMLLKHFDDTEPIAVKPKASYQKLLGDIRVQAFAFVIALPQRLVLTGFVLFLLPILLEKKSFDAKHIAYSVMLYFIVSNFLTMPLARLLDRFHCYRFLSIASLVVMALAMVLFYFANTSFALISFAIALLAVGMTANANTQTPIVPVILPRECDLYGKDTVVAYCRTVERVGSVVGPFIASLALTSFGQTSVTGLAGILFAFAALSSLFFLHTHFFSTVSSSN